MKVKLVCQDSLASPREIILSHFPVELGRGVDADIRIDDRWLSRRHCRLDHRDGAVLVCDLGSRHGTYVNGQAVTECKLEPGDELRIGLSHFMAECLPAETHSREAAPRALAHENSRQLVPVLA